MTGQNLKNPFQYDKPKFEEKLIQTDIILCDKQTNKTINFESTELISSFKNFQKAEIVLYKQQRNFEPKGVLGIDFSYLSDDSHNAFIKELPAY